MTTEEIARASIVAYIEPVRDQVLVLRDEFDSRSGGGLYVPDRSRTKPQWGTVLKLGQGRRTRERELAGEPGGYDHPFQVKAGDRVYFNFFAGRPVDTDDELTCRLVLMPEEEILAVGEAYSV